MSVELGSISDVGFSAPCISSAPSLGGEIGSTFSFADTIPLSTPTEFSLGGTFDPSFTSFSDLQPYSILDSSATLQNDLPSCEVPEAFYNRRFQASAYNAFAEEPVVEDLLTSPTYLETISEPIDIVDIPIVEPQSINNEQEIYQSEPVIDQSEAKMEGGVEEATIEIIDQIATSSDFVESPRNDMVEEVQEISTQISVIPSEVEDQALESTKFVEDCFVAEAPRNDIMEMLDTNSNEISEPALVEAVNELATLVETPMTIALPEVNAEVVTVSEVISSEQLATPEVAPIIQTNPETIQATKTLQAFVIAGVEEAQAVELVKDALIQTGTKTEVVEQMMVLVQIKQQVKSEVKTAQAEARVSTQAIKVEPAVAKAMAGEEEEKKKKRRFKFIKDKIALVHIFEAWKKAIWSVPGIKGAGEDVINSIDALVLMPTEVQNPDVKSGILPRYVLEWLNFGDGAYRTALSMAKDIGLRSRRAVLEKVFALHQKYYPVTVAEDGEEASKPNVNLVLTHKPNPIGAS